MSNRDINTAEPDLKEAWFKIEAHFRRLKWLSSRYDIRLAAVVRTNEEQIALYWKSRNPDGSQKYINGRRVSHVTFVDGVVRRSRHQPNKNGLSEAFDVFMLNKKTGRGDWANLVGYFMFGRLCKKYGLEWGGNWTNFRDYPHAQLPWRSSSW